MRDHAPLPHPTPWAQCLPGEGWEGCVVGRWASGSSCGLSLEVGQGMDFQRE